MSTDEHGWFECFAKQFLQIRVVPFSSVFIRVPPEIKPPAPEFAAIRVKRSGSGAGAQVYSTLKGLLDRFLLERARQAPDQLIELFQRLVKKDETAAFALLLDLDSEPKQQAELALECQRIG
jgi:hypothetical protein